MDKGQRKAYGAGIISSVGEMGHMLSDKPIFYDLDCEFAAREEFRGDPIAKM